CALPSCGDGILQVGEECDDNNDVDTDDCTNTCMNAACGDAIVWEGNEECDDGNDVDTDDCLSDCSAASCGDGVVWEGNEECDDGNMVDTDDCLNSCDAASCGDAIVWEGVEECDDGNMVDDDECSNMCTVPVASADCTILTDMNVWGSVARGVDLRAWTNSTLHYIGCPSSDGCQNTTFYCTYNQNAETLEFGSNSGTAMRSVVDPNNANGDNMPNVDLGCCNAPLGLCNSPDSNNNGVGINNAAALCNALGYQSGQYLASVNNNSCPEPHVTDNTGLVWTSDFVNSQGFGRIWLCTGFK
ncbi:MAG: DUF4215 domain-containing protein, partial [Nannocystaceae bacterium]